MFLHFSFMQVVNRKIKKKKIINTTKCCQGWVVFPRKALFSRKNNFKQNTYILNLTQAKASLWWFLKDLEWVSWNMLLNDTKHSLYHLLQRPKITNWKKTYFNEKLSSHKRPLFKHSIFILHEVSPSYITWIHVCNIKKFIIVTLHWN